MKKYILMIVCFFNFNGLCATEDTASLLCNDPRAIVRYLTVNKMNSRLYGLHDDLMQRENTGSLIAMLCNEGIDPNIHEGYLPSAPGELSVIGGNTPLHALFFYRPKDIKEKTAILLLAGADLEIKNKHGQKPLDYLLDDKADIATAVTKIKAAVPQVKQERESNRLQTNSSLTAIVTNGPATIITQYYFEPVWDETCVSLFEKHSGVKLGK